MDIKNTVTIMDITFLNVTKKDFLYDELFPRLNRQQKSFVVTANPEIVMKAREDHGYKQAVQSADYIVPDGAGILLAAKYKKEPLQERIPGYELMLDLLKHANDEGLRCYFLGAKDNVINKTIVEVEQQYPNITIAGSHHGFFDIHDSSIAENIKAQNPDIVFVALGLPRQEEWIAKHSNKFPKGLFMGVGGSFDVIAGEVQRAPEKWIKLNLEWLYRLLKQPLRFKRILKVFEFMLRIIVKK
ncbi:WecB/TagA/CpsF family glycosyltransferase [Virgibacillus byunsanensis]|uniref:N-acetylglucosaminyldiphosphoundecaprenol N-acetyl-beta-D-mannosaminyltransferase n=1 Tax=Virgibacillus byunsanensis TaxID=570945 RepID=A0ABW3LFI5_9BACI